MLNTVFILSVCEPHYCQIALLCEEVRNDRTSTTHLETFSFVVVYMNVIFTLLMGRCRYEEIKFLTQPRSYKKAELRADSRSLDLLCVLQSAASQVS